MDPYAFAYLLAAAAFVLPFGTYLLFAFLYKGKNKETVLKRISLIINIAAIVTFFSMMFFVPIAMTAKTGAIDGTYREGVGNVELIGVPYGENRAANFFAWLGIALFLPSAATALVFAFLPAKSGHFLQRYVSLPILILSFVSLFNLENAYLGSTTVSYKTALVAAVVGLSLSVCAKEALIHRAEKSFGKKTLLYSLGYFIFVFVSFLPMGTFASLVSQDLVVFGVPEKYWRVIDFSLMHRIFLYVGIAYYVALYFVLRHEEYEGIRAVLILVCIGGLASFFTSYGFEGIFDVSHGYRLMPTRLPIHLCHTALFVMPICAAFKLKKVFYFTYFINVFGALAAMVHPNNGDAKNMFDPEVILFWYNHLTAFFMPLVMVSLRVFDRPKMRNMVSSLVTFAIYFLLIMVANGWLSNYVPGYNPNVIGSGTDYLFINNDFILDIFGTGAKQMLLVKLIIPVGDISIVLYPLYQSLFFVGYVFIAFLMWYVYTFFYHIGDAHFDLHMHVLIARQNAISFKEARQMKLNETNQQQGRDEALLRFNAFSKKYGSSSKMAVNHLNLEVHGGQIFGFLGPNGAGKSTCIKSVIGIQSLTEGTIEVCGYDIAHESVAAKRLIGYVPDHYALYEKLTGREYINYVADLYGVSQEDRDERIGQYLDLFELSHAFDSRMETYSHGMKQKIAIIAALVHNPRVWILDEPLTGLDPQSVFQVKQTMIAHAKAGNVVFFSSHIIDVVERLCTDIAIILDGRIVFQGSMEKIERDHPEGLEKFYMSFVMGGHSEGGAE